MDRDLQHWQRAATLEPDDPAALDRLRRLALRMNLRFANHGLDHWAENLVLGERFEEALSFLESALPFSLPFILDQFHNYRHTMCQPTARALTAYRDRIEPFIVAILHDPQHRYNLDLAYLVPKLGAWGSALLLTLLDHESAKIHRSGVFQLPLFDDADLALIKEELVERVAGDRKHLVSFGRILGKRGFLDLAAWKALRPWFWHPDRIVQNLIRDLFLAESSELRWRFLQWGDFEADSELWNLCVARDRRQGTTPRFTEDF